MLLAALMLSAAGMAATTAEFSAQPPSESIGQQPKTLPKHLPVVDHRDDEAVAKADRAYAERTAPLPARQREFQPEVWALGGLILVALGTLAYYVFRPRPPARIGGRHLR